MLPQELDNPLLTPQHEDESDNDLSTDDSPNSPDSLDSLDSLSPTSTICNDDHPEAYKSVPLVLVTGFLAPSWKTIWGPLEKLQDTMTKTQTLRNRVFLHVTPGMCSSVHDRACEIFFQLKGGKVDYGEEHSREAGHQRYGRDYEGTRFPSDSHLFVSIPNGPPPIHFIFSAILWQGGPTIYKLQELLATGFFVRAGHANTDADWIRSMTGVSAPFRGTTAVYLLGSQPYPYPPGAVHPFSFGSVVYRLLHLYEHLVPSSLRRMIYDLQVDHWDFARHGLWACLKKSPWAEGTDNAPYDLCVGSRWRDWEKMRRERAEGRGWGGVGKKTWYRSFATCLAGPTPLFITSTPSDPDPTPTSATPISTFASSLIPAPLHQLTVLPLHLLSLWVSHHRFTPGTSALSPDELTASRSFHLDPSRWRRNDGLCSTVGQYHPGGCRQCGGWAGDSITDDDDDQELECRHRKQMGMGYAMYGREDMEKKEGKRPGVWYVTEMEGMSHLDLGLWNGSDMQMLFWSETLEWLGKVDKWAEEKEEKGRVEVGSSKEEGIVA
ncbi:hypothetical protein BC937DRAFT_94704 [Endogone sp. FLAS-F59071]|nr:hypothetical protein BC937DRAFT_94704 [Endogone sp. FLAS-F59071]|eukprot:RUS13835.1 hypothetical protein BC937DRAFT_94704 [Endogone sp. FLAS-F59071]